MEIAVRTTDSRAYCGSCRVWQTGKTLSRFRLAAHPRRCKRFDDHRNRHGTGRNFLLSSGYTSHWFGCHPGAAVIRLRSYASRRRTGFKDTK